MKKPEKYPALKKNDSCLTTVPVAGSKSRLRAELPTQRGHPQKWNLIPGLETTL